MNRAIECIHDDSPTSPGERAARAFVLSANAVGTIEAAPACSALLLMDVGDEVFRRFDEGCLTHEAEGLTAPRVQYTIPDLFTGYTIFLGYGSG